MLENITPLVLTYNEEPNIARSLERLRWARRVVVVDSQSMDRTVPLAAGFPNVELHSRPFDNHTAQWNFGVGLAATEWVLSLDADYILDDAFVAELRALQPADDIDAYDAPFRYCLAGRRLRGSLYPPRAVLFRKSRCRYVADGHTQLLDVPGKRLPLVSPIDHDDRKSLSRWFASQDKYAVLEAEKLSNAKPSELRLQDRLRLMLVPAPLVVLFYTLFVKGLILDGWHGWYYTLQRVTAEVMLSMRLVDRQLNDE